MKNSTALDLAIKVPPCLLQILKSLTLVICSSDVFYYITQVIVQILCFYKVDGFNPTDFIVVWVIYDVHNVYPPIAK